MEIDWMMWRVSKWISSPILPNSSTRSNLIYPTIFSFCFVSYVFVCHVVPNFSFLISKLKSIFSTFFLVDVRTPESSKMTSHPIMENDLCWYENTHTHEHIDNSIIWMRFAQLLLLFSHYIFFLKLDPQIK